jgi:hypothetical protein
MRVSHGTPVSAQGHEDHADGRAPGQAGADTAGDVPGSSAVLDEAAQWV